MLVATAHGNELSNLIKNPTLSDLVGGIQSVTLGDEEARRRRTQKTVLERAADPTFALAVEMHNRHRWLVHRDVARTVDLLLRGQRARPEVRELDGDGQLRLQQNPSPTPGLAPRPLPLPDAPPGSVMADEPLAPLPSSSPSPSAASASPPASPPASLPVLRLFGVGMGRSLLEQVVRARQLPVEVVDSVALADAVLSLRQELGRDPHLRRQAQDLGLPILVLKSAAQPQLQRAMERLLERRRQPPPDADAAPASPGPLGDDAHAGLEECRLAVERVVLPHGQPVELLPRSPRVRLLQAELAGRYRLRTAVFGRGAEQRLRVFPA
jgi:hypothetical protein